MEATEPEPPTILDRTVDHTSDASEIRAIVADIESGLNSNNADLMTVHFATNATVVGANGIPISGRHNLYEAHVRGLAGFLRNEHARYDVTDIVFIRPDIALAHKQARATDATGNAIDPEPTMIALYVLAKSQNRWWVIARQNTLIPV